MWQQRGSFECFKCYLKVSYSGFNIPRACPYSVSPIESQIWNCPGISYKLKPQNFQCVLWHKDNIEILRFFPLFGNVINTTVEMSKGITFQRQSRKIRQKISKTSHNSMCHQLKISSDGEKWQVIILNKTQTMCYMRSPSWLLRSTVIYFGTYWLLVIGYIATINVNFLLLT